MFIYMEFKDAEEEFTDIQQIMCFEVRQFLFWQRRLAGLADFALNNLRQLIPEDASFAILPNKLILIVMVFHSGDDASADMLR